MVWVKTLHIITVMIWCGGLIGVLAAHARLASVEASDRDRFEKAARFALVGVVSPAAFIAIGTGAALPFLRDVFVPWFSLKLVFVGVLILVHMRVARATAMLGERPRPESRSRRSVLTAGVLLSATAVLVLVLGKPPLTIPLPDGFAEPGMLGRMVTGR